MLHELSLVLALLAGGGIGYYLVHRRRRAARLRRIARHRALEGAGPVAVAAAMPGPVTLRGRARALKTRQAPASGEEVIGFRLQLEQHGGGEDSEWQLALDVARVGPFELRDSSGEARVEACSEAPLLLDLGLEELAWRDAVPGGLETFLGQQGVVPAVRRRWREGRLVEGDDVIVSGRCRREHDPERGAGYRDSPGVVVAPPGDGTPLVIRANLPEGARTGFKF